MAPRQAWTAPPPPGGGAARLHARACGPPAALRKALCSMVKQVDFEAELEIEPERLRAFVQALFEGAGTEPQQAGLVAGLLVDNDLHGASSHGTNLPHGWGYLKQMREGSINPNPVPKVISDEGSCRVYDGDGGIGHPVCYEAMTWCIQRAKEVGVAVATTRNHHHFGAAVQWGRMALQADCIGIAVSSHRYELDQNRSVSAVNGTSPISIVRSRIAKSASFDLSQVVRHACAVATVSCRLFPAVRKHPSPLTWVHRSDFPTKRNTLT